MIRVGIELKRTKGDSKIYNISKTQKDDGNKGVRRGKEYTMRFERKLKRYWTNGSKIAQNPQHG